MSNTFLIESATKVKLRGRVNSSGELVSLYLDWMENGKRNYEFLPDRMYHKPKTKEQKDHNDIVLTASKKALGIKNLYLLNDTTALKNHHASIYFKDFYSFVRDQKKPDGDKKEIGTKAIYDNAFKKVETFVGVGIDKLRLKDIDSKWVWNYRDYLLNLSISKSTASCYFQNLFTVLEMAVKKDYILKNPMINVDPIRKGDPEVNYIFFEDLQKLRLTQCRDEVLKKASLFASQTGLRASDIKPLKWKHISFYDNKYSITVHQQKTDKPYIVHFKQSVMDIIGPAGDPDDLVFPGFKNDVKAGDSLVIWFMKAGVVPRGKPEQDFTFHDFRHTFAILLGLNGVDLYGISQMLGHTEVATTEKYYARVLDQIKRSHIDKLPEF